MKMSATKKKIVEAADRLFYQQGFEKTSFADIADVVQISRGNFYYHFKTKDEILEAVIAHRVINTNAMLQNWQIEGETPQARIKSFIHILNANGSKIKKYGCPLGTLSSELAKLNHQAQNDARGLFVLFREWLREQFIQLGLDENAEEHAQHLLARSQGVATLYQAFQDDDFVEREISQMERWLENLIQDKAKE